MTRPGDLTRPFFIVIYCNAGKWYACRDCQRLIWAQVNKNNQIYAKIVAAKVRADMATLKEQLEFKMPSSIMQIPVMA